MDVKKITRFEVIDETGRVYTRNTAGTQPGVQVELSLQDDGRTLKVFVSARKPTPVSR